MSKTSPVTVSHDKQFSTGCTRHIDPAAAEPRILERFATFSPSRVLLRSLVRAIQIGILHIFKTEGISCPSNLPRFRYYSSGKNSGILQLVFSVYGGEMRKNDAEK
jgi:hypothetical protein